MVNFWSNLVRRRSCRNRRYSKPSDPLSVALVTIGMVAALVAAAIFAILNSSRPEIGQ